ncbi:MAG TPA: class I SAM-dependent methyltransferase, partial [Pyrinomonadaceae bacterium]|nr:class I SAM-dependent methyltransferase [Pyrinomonadaceae bacterium]
LAELLRLTGIEYHSPADATRLPFSDRSFDFHISNTVLEHVPGDIISGILSEARRVLTPEGLLIHFIDPSDHFSHDDNSITAVNFLQFDQRAWDGLAGNQFMYHNRLRSHQHLELFERAGVRVLRQEKQIDDVALSALQNGFHLDENFKSLAPEELAITTLDVMGTFTHEGAKARA